MKKRWLSRLLALCLMLTLLPVPALAFEKEPLPYPDDPIPEFVPGIKGTEDYELKYPDYANLPQLMEGELPASYDTRGTTQTAVKNQGSNGICWAFGTMAAMEAQIKKTYGEQDLSELHMVYSLSGCDGNDKEGFHGREPSMGGSHFGAASYLMRGTNLSGAVDEASDPYITTKLEGRELELSRIKEKVWQAQNILFLTKAKDDAAFDTIKRAVQTYGGVGASMFFKGQTTATDGSETGLFYNSETHAYCYNWNKDSGAGKPDSTSNINHGVEIAGWDDNYPKENFTEFSRPAHNGAWLIKNSWGKNWGDGGYAWISYEDTNFPQETFCFDGVKPYDPGEIVYETDYLYSGGVTSVKNVSELYCAKTFPKETDGNEKLTAVRVFLSSPFKSVQVGCSPTSSETSLSGYSFQPLGEIVSDTGVSPPGWYTIELKEPVVLTGEKGSALVAAVKISAPKGQDVWICGDTQNTLDKGKTFCSVSGTSWSDLGSNCCIKAITKSVNSLSCGQVIVDKAADSLLWPLIRGENPAQNAIRTDLTLPTRFKGADVTWRSSDTDVIRTNGTVTRPTADSDRPVRLTATLSTNGAEASVYFDLTVEGPSAYLNVSDPKRVTVDNVPLSSAVFVYAAHYDSGGRMTGIAKAASVNGNEIRFGSDVGSGWKLFCLDGNHAPVCTALIVEQIHPE